MIELKTDSKQHHPKEEYEMLTRLDSPYLIKLIGEDFYFQDSDLYCFLTEFYEVNIKFLTRFLLIFLIISLSDVQIF